MGLNCERVVMIVSVLWSSFFVCCFVLMVWGFSVFVVMSVLMYVVWNFVVVWMWVWILLKGGCLGEFRVWFRVVSVVFSCLIDDMSVEWYIFLFENLVLFMLWLVSIVVSVLVIFWVVLVIRMFVNFLVLVEWVW